MSRRTLGMGAPEWSEPSKQEEWTLQIRVITPMFGGGYEPREVDPVCVIRPAAIRGHLRFWWRATAGAQYGSSEELFKAEEALWGSAEKPGAVGIRTVLKSRGQSEKCGKYIWDDRRGRYRALPRFRQGWPPYALQPFQGELEDDGRKIKTDCAEAVIETQFVLIVTAPQTHMAEVKSAITAWIRYGGLGARSRRGCGSLGTDSDLPPIILPDLHPAMKEDLTLLNGSKFVLGPEMPDVLKAWEKAVRTYNEFRQGPGFARDPASGTPTPGRSRWPEPDSIRRLAGPGPFVHSPIHNAKGFPRADLGLPIIFHFKDYDDRRRSGQPNDPADTTLEGPKDGMRRFASPVITKAIQVAPGKFRPLVLVLNAPHVWHYGDLKLSGGANTTVTQSHIDLSTSERAKIHPLNAYSNKPIREALLEYVAKQWGSKVEVIK